MSAHLARLLASASAQPPRPVRVRIERVVVGGIQMTPAQARQFGAALALELQHLARAPGWPADAAGVRVPWIVAPSVSAVPGVTPGALGRDVARSLFDAVRGAR